MKNKKFYTAKNDHAFKEIFMKEENKDILIPLLEECLHVNIYDIIYLNVEDRVDYINVRKKTYDLRLSTNIGIIQLEVNANIYLYSKNRQMAYISNEYSHYTLSGEEYDEDINIIQINFTYGLMKNFREGNRNLYDDKPYRIYKVMDDDCKLYVNNFKIYDFNMDYFMKYWYNKDEEMINRYKLFIMMDLGIKELNNLVSISKEDKVVSKYMEEIDRINRDPGLVHFISYEEDQRKLINTWKKKTKKILEEQVRKKAIKEGMKQWIEQGMKQGIEQATINVNKENAIKMLEKGIKIEDISDITGLSVREIEELLKNNL